MELSAKIQSLVKARIFAFSGSRQPDPLEIRTIAKKIHALPIYQGCTGFLALRPDGTIIFHDLEKKISLREQEPVWIRMVLSRASTAFPELSELSPEQPARAIPCDQCSGTGKINHPVVSHCLCRCGGRGWITPSTRFPKFLLGILWSFARGDFDTHAFEESLNVNYAIMEQHMENGLFMELIALNFKDDRAVAKIRLKLKKYLTTIPGQQCCCIQLRNRFSMGVPSPAQCPELSSMHSVRLRTPWLHLKHCDACGEWWYLAIDSSKNNIHWYRLNSRQSTKVLETNNWPSSFDTMRAVWPTKQWLKLSGFESLEHWQDQNAIPNDDYFFA
jgi:hypothetical protein